MDCMNYNKFELYPALLKKYPEKKWQTIKM